jgi:hypothetical protein
MESITESELGRLGRHHAVLIRTAVLAPDATARGAARGRGVWVEATWQATR